MASALLLEFAIVIPDSKIHQENENHAFQIAGRVKMAVAFLQGSANANQDTVKILHQRHASQSVETDVLLTGTVLHQIDVSATMDIV